MHRDMPTHLHFNRHLTIDAPSPAAESLVYEMQPIAYLHSMQVFGYELLYRGPRPASWAAVDRQLLHFLASGSIGLPPLFVNLANETLLSEDQERFVAAAQSNDLFFELSEEHASAARQLCISEQVNDLSERGVRFAIDDFGSGVDGFGRLFALDQIAIIKLDGSLVRLAAARATAAAMLRNVISHWREFDILTVAECIETPEMLDLSRNLGVDLVQGYHVDSLVAHAPSLLVPGRGAGIIHATV